MRALYTDHNFFGKDHEHKLWRIWQEGWSSDTFAVIDNSKLEIIKETCLILCIPVRYTIGEEVQ